MVEVIIYWQYQLLTNLHVWSLKKNTKQLREGQITAAPKLRCVLFLFLLYFQSVLNKRQDIYQVNFTKKNFPFLL